MTSNVYTKSEILQKLASKGFFIDVYTLDTFFEKWKVEAIFEDEQGSEFYDTNALDLVLNNLFNSQNVEPEEEVQEEPRVLKFVQPPIEDEQDRQRPMYEQNQAPPMFEQPRPMAYEQPRQMPYEQPRQMVYEQPRQVAYEQPRQIPYGAQQRPYFQPQPQPQQREYIDVETNKLLNNISLSDGTPLINKVSNNPLDDYMDYQKIENEAIKEQEPSWRTKLYAHQEEPPKEEKKIGILEGALRNAEDSSSSDTEKTETIDAGSEEPSEIDDISLLSESLDAQEKFREYIVSELSKKNLDLTPKNNEFKLDISERTLNMIARSLAKKIAKQVNQICSADSKAVEQLAEMEEQNKLLEVKARDLEEQNKKLRLLIAESNKNLSSYKKVFWIFFRKVTPKK